MAFGKRLTPPTIEKPAEAIAPPTPIEPPKPVLHPIYAAPAGPSAPPKIMTPAQEFLGVLIDAFKIGEDDDARPVFHRPTVLAVAASVAGQMAVRLSFTELALDSMPARLAPGAADGPIFASVGQERTLYDMMRDAVRHRVLGERAPDPRQVKRTLDEGALTLPPAYFPHVNALTLLDLYDAIAMKIVRREGLGRREAMMMAGECMALTLREEKDDTHLPMLMRLALEVMFHSARINPKLRETA